MNNALPFFFSLLLFQMGGAFGQAPCQATLHLDHQGNLLIITGLCQSLSPQPGRYRYQLQVVRESRSGRSQNSQGGEFELPAQQQALLSRVEINAGPQDHYRAVLTVFALSGAPISQDTSSELSSR